MSKQNILITVQNGAKTIKVRMPPRPDLLESSLKFLSDGQVEEITQDNENRDYPSRISRELVKNQEFNKVFSLANEEFNEWSYQQYKLSNIVEIQIGKNSMELSQTLNKIKWSKSLMSLMENIVIKNVEFIIVHIASNISGKGKRTIIDNFAEEFSHVQIKDFFSQRKYSSTLIELFLFGEDLEGY